MKASKIASHWVVCIAFDGGARGNPGVSVTFSFQMLGFYSLLSSTSHPIAEHVLPPYSSNSIILCTIFLYSDYIGSRIWCRSHHYTTDTRQSAKKAPQDSPSQICGNLVNLQLRRMVWRLGRAFACD